ncbi:hypothetical protein DL771_007957 [Monosporascus sp. 5C6A]|nr:hypothetical protein DL771_007957 [Monosporascus sp. 5C6A]
MTQHEASRRDPAPASSNVGTLPDDAIVLPSDHDSDESDLEEPEDEDSSQAVPCMSMSSQQQQPHEPGPLAASSPRSSRSPQHSEAQHQDRAGHETWLSYSYRDDEEVAASAKISSCCHPEPGLLAAGGMGLKSVPTNLTDAKVESQLLCPAKQNPFPRASWSESRRRSKWAQPDKSDGKGCHSDAEISILSQPKRISLKAAPDKAPCSALSDDFSDDEGGNNPGYEPPTAQNDEDKDHSAYEISDTHFSVPGRATPVRRSHGIASPLSSYGVSDAGSVNPGPLAIFEEWPLQDVTLKRVTENGVTTDICVLRKLPSAISFVMYEPEPVLLFPEPG